MSVAISMEVIVWLSLDCSMVITVVSIRCLPFSFTSAPSADLYIINNVNCFFKNLFLFSRTERVNLESQSEIYETDLMSRCDRYHFYE